MADTLLEDVTPVSSADFDPGVNWVGDPPKVPTSVWQNLLWGSTTSFMLSVSSSLETVSPDVSFVPFANPVRPNLDRLELGIWWKVTGSSRNLVMEVLDGFGATAWSMTIAPRESAMLDTLMIESVTIPQEYWVDGYAVRFRQLAGGSAAQVQVSGVQLRHYQREEPIIEEGVGRELYEGLEPTKTTLVWGPGGNNRIEATIRTDQGVLVSDATVELVVVDLNGEEVGGETWPLVCTQQAVGVYAVTIGKGLEIAPGESYEARVTSVSPSAGRLYSEVHVLARSAL